jgi:FkbM family methyltransferase
VIPKVEAVGAPKAGESRKIAPSVDAARSSAGCGILQSGMPSVTKPERPLGFILASTDHGTMILNRFDEYEGPGGLMGAGYQLLARASYEPKEVAFLLQLLDLRRKYYGDGILAIDCGANLGMHTIEWAKHMTEWGVVVAFEAQERIYYALAGNVAINNCFNARAMNAAVSNHSGWMKIPQLNHLAHASFGSLELRKLGNTEFVGQLIDYSEDKMVNVPMVHLDSFNFPRLDLLKIDVEGMELQVIEGAATCISKNRPIMFVEALKSDPHALHARLESLGYSVFADGFNFIAFHKQDKCLEAVQFAPAKAASAA